MTSINRRRALVTGAALISAPALVLPRFARAAEFTYKFGTNVPATHPLNVRAMEAAERILKDTGGQVQINVFPKTSSATTPTCSRSCAQKNWSSSPCRA